MKDDKFFNWIFVFAFFLTLAFWGLVIWGLLEGIMWLREQ